MTYLCRHKHTIQSPRLPLLFFDDYSVSAVDRCVPNRGIQHCCHQKCCEGNIRLPRYSHWRISTVLSNCIQTGHKQPMDEHRVINPRRSITNISLCEGEIILAGEELNVLEASGDRSKRINFLPTVFTLRSQKQSVPWSYFDECNKLSEQQIRVSIYM